VVEAHREASHKQTDICQVSAPRSALGGGGIDRSVFQSSRGEGFTFGVRISSGLRSQQSDRGSGWTACLEGDPRARPCCARALPSSCHAALSCSAVASMATRRVRLLGGVPLIGGRREGEGRDPGLRLATRLRLDGEADRPGDEHGDARTCALKRASERRRVPGCCGVEGSGCHSPRARVSICSGRRSSGAVGCRQHRFSATRTRMASAISATSRAAPLARSEAALAAAAWARATSVSPSESASACSAPASTLAKPGACGGSGGYGGGGGGCGGGGGWSGW
jgi:hypothetical protein